jgi:glycosyltransferase involved in cell wall biosynthesis
LPDQIRHRYDGLLVPAADPDALGAAISLLLERPEAARRLAHNGLRRIAAWTHAELVEQIEASYRELLAARATSSS